jgi:hypothetical protein
MNLDKLNLTKYDKYWLYILNSNNVNDFLNYDKPYFTIPNNEYIQNEEFKSGDIIILIMSKKICYNFIGFVQINDKVVINNKKIKIFKDALLNANYVPLKFRMLCIGDIKLSNVLKELKIKTPEFTNSTKFISKFAKKHIIMSALPATEGKQIIKHLIKLKEEAEQSSNSSDDSTSDTNTIDTETTLDTNTSDKNTSDDESSEHSSEESKEEEKGLIPIMIIPCSNFNIGQAKNKITYFVDHYKGCTKCEVTNNNKMELNSIINACNFEFHEIKEEKHAYFNPALEQYIFGMNYEPIDSLDYPFVRIIYINNNHLIYNKCILIAWIIQ